MLGRSLIAPPSPALSLAENRVADLGAAGLARGLGLNSVLTILECVRDSCRGGPQRRARSEDRVRGRTVRKLWSDTPASNRLDSHSFQTAQTRTTSATEEQWRWARALQETRLWFACSAYPPAACMLDCDVLTAADDPLRSPHPRRGLQPRKQPNRRRWGGGPRRGSEEQRGGAEPIVRTPSGQRARSRSKAVATLTKRRGRSLYGNSVGDTGAAALGQALESNAALVYLL